MKICIVSGTFQPGRGYQENTWARQLAAEGHTVRVLSAGLSLDRFPNEPDTNCNYETIVVPTLVLPRSVLLSRDLDLHVEAFAPDLVLWFCPGQFFGRALTSSQRTGSIPVVSFFSEGYYLHEFDWKKHGIGLKQRLIALTYRLLRGKIVRAGCLRSDVIVGNVPETQEILQLKCRDDHDRKDIAAKTLTLPLGYNPNELARKIETGPCKDRFIREPLADQPRLNELYNAADIALFPRASISCQAALATGLIACFADGMSMNHLLKSTEQGVFYQSMDIEDLARQLLNAANLVPQPDPTKTRTTGRQSLAAQSRSLGYDRIIATVMRTVANRSLSAVKGESAASESGAHRSMTTPTAHGNHRLGD